VHFDNFLSVYNGNYNTSWMYNSSTDTLHFVVEVRATGWIGFGVATQAPANMSGYDVAVGGVISGGIGYLKVKHMSVVVCKNTKRISFNYENKIRLINP